MNRREFLEKFVALSSVSLILAGCVEQPKKDIKKDVKHGKKIIGSEIKEVVVEPKNDRAMAVYGPPPIPPEPMIKPAPIEEER